MRLSHSICSIAGANNVANAVCYLGTPQTPYGARRASQVAFGLFCLSLRGFVICPTQPFLNTPTPLLPEMPLCPFGGFSRACSFFCFFCCFFCWFSFWRCAWCFCCSCFCCRCWLFFLLCSSFSAFSFWLCCCCFVCLAFCCLVVRCFLGFLCWLAFLCRSFSWLFLCRFCSLRPWLWLLPSSRFSFFWSFLFCALLPFLACRSWCCWALVGFVGGLSPFFL